MYRLKRTPDLLAALHDHARRARGWRLAYFLQLFTSLLLVVLLLVSAARRDGAAGAGRVPFEDTRPVEDVLPPRPEPEPPVIPLPEPVAAPLPELEVRLILCTAYCQCPLCCGEYSDGITACGKPVSANGGHFVAADTTHYPFQTRLSIPGYADGRPVPVLDRGGAIKGPTRLDLFFADDPGNPGSGHRKALKWGRRWVAVTILREGQR